MLLGQSVVLLAVALAVGLEAPIEGVTVGLVLVLLLGIGFAATSYAIALHVSTPEGLASVLNGAALPLLLLSGVLLPMSLAPPWLDTLSRANPLRWIVDAERAAFRGEVMDVDVLYGLIAAALMAIFATFAGIRAFARVASQ
jgi:ABC-2 type transport system permease protein